MKDIVAFAMLFPFLLFFLIQPMLHDVEEARGTVIQVAVERATEKAAIEGYYAHYLIDEIKEKLTAIGFDENEIEIDATDTIQYRGEYVSATVKVPNKYFFILGKPLLLFDDGNEEVYHIHSATRMSEYVG